MGVRHARNERSPSAEIGVRHQPKSSFGLLRNQRSISPEIHSYDRLEWPALAALERIHDLASDYVNFLHPVRKLVSKTRSGPRVTRRYDIASTPFHRLLDSGVLSIAMTRQLQKRSHSIDPYRLKVQLEHAQRPRSSIISVAGPNACARAYAPRGHSAAASGGPHVPPF
jgi:hypothetical protein